MFCYWIKVAVSAVMACVGRKRMMLPPAQKIASIIGLTLPVGLELIKSWIFT